VTAIELGTFARARKILSGATSLTEPQVYAATFKDCGETQERPQFSNVSSGILVIQAFNNSFPNPNRRLVTVMFTAPELQLTRVCPSAN
jgi:hypothetical protein